MSKKTVYLIDGSSFLYRAFYALKPMVSPSGTHIGAVYGFCRMVKKVIDTFNPEYLALVWDSKGPTQRHELYSQYKETRQAAPMHLFDQKFIIQEFAQQIHLPQIEKSGYEADDLLYSVARDFSQKGYHVVLITTDKDLAQAVDENIVLYDAFKQEMLDKAAIELRYGFPLEKLPFYFALTGDSSDNIPGVRGIGPKGATDLVQQFDSLEDLYERIQEVPKERARELLKACQQEAFLSEQLFLLRYINLNLSEKDLHFSPSDWQLARGFFDKYDFKSLLKELPAGIVDIAQRREYKPHAEYSTVTDINVLQQVIEEIKKHKSVSIDTETDGVTVSHAKLVGLSVAIKPGKAYYIPFDHVHKGELSQDEVLQACKPIFADASIKKYFHHAKFDMHILANAGIAINGLDFDTLVAASLLRKDNERIGLKVLSETYFNEPMLSYDDIVKKNKYKDFSHVPLDIATEYAAADAHQTLKLVDVLKKELEAEKLSSLYYDIELPIVSILFAMEQYGIYCDTHVLDELNERVTHDLEKIHEEIIALVGQRYFAINLNSPQQLKELLFEDLKLPPSKKTTSRAHYSTDQEVLEELAGIHPVPALIIKYRELAKLKSTYIEGLRQWINPKTHKIHTTFNQTLVATGRLSSSDPNLQNIPTLAEDDKRLHIRSAFKADPGQIFISADYSQIELRVVAYLSQDKALLHAFKNNSDIHAHTAAGLFEVPEDKVTREQRQIGKRINFSILYGLTPYGLAKDLNIPFTQAKKYIDKYFEEHPGIVKWMDAVVEKTKERGYVETLWGRRRYVPGIYERNKTLYDAARRIAINTPAQGTQSELMKIAMIKLDQRFKKDNLDAQMVLQIHDEILVAAAEDQKAHVQKVILEVMQHVVDWNVPLVVTLAEGYSWAEASK
ncbi:MAG: DNA polymerase I [Candidatus Babeliaceae bacterium]|nr:DNA polymerase I [Candidatus Babeliaceae bacterium]